MLEHLIKCKSNNVLVSFSGGRTSAFMCHMMLNSPTWNTKNLVFVFANTGRERDETLEFVDRVDREYGLNLVWVEALVNPERGVGTSYTLTNFKDAKRNGEPFEEVIKKYGIPNYTKPHCTRELKLRPIHAYMKSLYGKDYVTALGIRLDEVRRAGAYDDNFVYPLIPETVRVKQVRDFWNEQAFDLKLKDYEGNCDFCWKKSKRKKMTLLQENFHITTWWKNMEDLYAEVDDEKYYFNRSNQSITDLIKEAEAGFVPVTDEFWKDEKNDDMDFEKECACFNVHSEEYIAIIKEDTPLKGEGYY